MKKSSTIAVLTAFLLSGCSSKVFDSSLIDEIDIKNNTVNRGVIYALPRGLVSTTIERKKTNGVDVLDVTMNDPIIIPDTNLMFHLEYKKDTTSTDSIVVQTNKKGLLTSVSTTTEDAVPSVINDFSDLIVGIAKSGITGSGAGERVAAPGRIDDGPFKIEARFRSI